MNKPTIHEAYLKILRDGGDIAVTAPVWVGEVEAAGISGISTTQKPSGKGEAYLPVTLDLYNNENTRYDIQLPITFFVDGENVHEVNLEKNNLTKWNSLGTASHTFD